MCNIDDEVIDCMFVLDQSKAINLNKNEHHNETQKVNVILSWRDN